MRDLLSRRRQTGGSAAVEFLVLLPVFILILFAMFYVGELAIYKGRALYGSQFAMDLAGDQSEARAVRGAVSAQFYPSRFGELAVVERPPTPADIPEDGEIREMFDEMTQPVYSVQATGRYVFSGGQLRFVVTTSQNRRLSADGQYVQRYNLLGDNVPELSTDILQGWARRNLVELNYAYQPYYIRLGEWPLDPVELFTRYQSVVRDTKQREVYPIPPGTNHAIETLTTNVNMRGSGRLPHYPDFRGDQAFWEPN